MTKNKVISIKPVIIDPLKYLAEHRVDYPFITPNINLRRIMEELILNKELCVSIARLNLFLLSLSDTFNTQPHPVFRPISETADSEANFKLHKYFDPLVAKNDKQKKQELTNMLFLLHYFLPTITALFLNHSFNSFYNNDFNWNALPIGLDLEGNLVEGISQTVSKTADYHQLGGYFFTSSPFPDSAQRHSFIYDLMRLNIPNDSLYPIISMSENRILESVLGNSKLVKEFRQINTNQELSYWIEKLVTQVALYYKQLQHPNS